MNPHLHQLFADFALVLLSIPRQQDSDFAFDALEGVVDAFGAAVQQGALSNLTVH